MIGALATEAATAQPARESYEFALPPMPLRKALSYFAQQTDISIAYDGNSVDEFRSGMTYGAFTPGNALEKILARTPFAFEFMSHDTVRLVARSKIEPSSSVLGLPKSFTARAPDTILVTATKRTAYAQELPVSISAVDEHTLDRWGVRDFNALATKVAGVSFTNLGPSRNKIFVRGLSDGAFADRTQSTVGVYLDETPIIFNDTNPDLRLVDVERVEIVRGPQGTLYGAGSIGGVYRIITKKPHLNNYSGRMRASGSTTVAGGANGSFDGFFNAPIIENRLGIRLAGFYENSDGYIDDPGLGLKDLNASEIYGGRLSSRVQFSDRWTLDAAATAQFVDLEDTQYVFPRFGKLRRRNLRREPYRDEFLHFNATLNGEVRGATITSSTAFIRRDISNTLDASASLPDIIGVADAEGVYQTQDKIRTINHETRIVSEDDRQFEWLAGGFFSRRQEDLIERLVVDNMTPESIPFVGDRNDDIRETALFGEASYRVTDRLKLTAGMRWSHTMFEADIAATDDNSEITGRSEDSKTETSYSPKVALSYEVRDDLLAYAQVARGSRIGGFNVRTPLEAITQLDPEDDTSEFESDTLWNFETGLKSAWLNNDLTLNAAAFYVRWAEIQTDQILPTGITFIANAGTARNYGFEIELTGRPAPNLEIAGALFWNSPELTEANPFLGAEAGDALPNIPSVSGSLAAAFSFPITNQWEGIAYADYSYVGRSFLTFAKDAAPRMGDYHVGSLRFTARNNALRFGLFVDNFWNERGNTFAFGNPFSLSREAQSTPLRPRTIGVFAETKF